jgi:hypothetical protein
MPDYRKLFDSKYLYAIDLKGRSVGLTIEAVEGATVISDGAKDRKPIVYFRESKARKGLLLNRTNARTIADLYGMNTEGWIGKRVTLFPTTTTFGERVVDCIRIRAGKQKAAT